jgi:outer membrane protein
MITITVRGARRSGFALALLSLAALGHPSVLGAQGTPAEARALSLDEALRLGESTSEVVRVARAGAERARGDQIRARSQLLPQLYGSLGYTRTLKSQFEALQGAPDTRPECMAFTPDPSLPADQRIAQLEAALLVTSNCRAGGGIDFSRVGFGAKNQYQLGLSASQSLFSGFRVSSQVVAAGAGRTAAEIELRAQRAQALLDITEAYYDAVLAGRLAVIAESSLVQTEAVLRQTTLARQVGNTSEFDLLRARVTRDNQLPQVIERRAQRELAMLRLKQLLELPLAAEVRLTTDLADTVPAPARLATLTGGAAPDTSADDRAAVRQADASVRAQEALLRSARGQRLPSVSLTSQYGRVAYPNAGVPGWNDFTQNWTVGVAAQVPLFVGGRIRGDEMVARANLAEARARREQAREFAALDALSTITSLRQAEAAFAASAGTSEQAARAYTIAELRYAEGISTQTELSEARLLLQQASANRAWAARNLQVARIRLALLKDLPLGTGGSALGQEAGGAQQQQQQQPQQQPQGQTADITQASQAGGFAP